MIRIPYAIWFVATRGFLAWEYRKATNEYTAAATLGLMVPVWGDAMILSLIAIGIKEFFWPTPPPPSNVVGRVDRGVFVAGTIVDGQFVPADTPRDG